jgi:hypothetical protein
MSVDEVDKNLSRMNVIMAALNDGWTVKKSSLDSKTFEFTKNQSMDLNYRGLIIFSTKPSICEDIQNHLDNLNNVHKKIRDSQNMPKDRTKRSISTPISKN